MSIKKLLKVNFLTDLKVIYQTLYCLIDQLKNQKKKK